MSLKCGIIGLPNVGKSTLFNVLTKDNLAVSANFPFCTIKPNVGVVAVMDSRLDTLAKIVFSQKIINAYIEFIDIAGLVKGASKGEGLGNQFLNNIRDTHAIVHVVRCFEDNNVTHIYDSIEPKRDIDIIKTELILSDFDTCEASLIQLKKKKILKNQNIDQIIHVLEKCLAHLKNCVMLNALNLNIDEKTSISYLRLLTLKPTMYVANINDQSRSLSFLNDVYEIGKKENAPVIPISVSLELDLMQMNKLEQQYFMEEFNIKRLGLNNVIIESYKLLNLITFFTVGVKETRAWPILYGSTSLEASHKIHSDFSKGFIRAQIIKYNDFITYKNESKIKEMGKFRTEGKNYQIQDGDIVHFLFNI